MRGWGGRAHPNGSSPLRGRRRNCHRIFHSFLPAPMGSRNRKGRWYGDPASGLKILFGIVEDRCPVKDNLQNSTPVSVAVEKEYNVS